MEFPRVDTCMVDLFYTDDRFMRYQLEERKA